MNIEGSNTYVTPFDYNLREGVQEERRGATSIHPLYRDEIAEFERMHQIRSSKSFVFKSMIGEDFQYDPESRPEINRD